MNGDQSKGGLPRSRTSILVTRYSGQQHFDFLNLVAVEEPLEIFVNNNLLYTTMRSPGEEMLLALGYCFTQGIIESIDDIMSIAYCKEETGNRIDLFLPPSYEKGKGNPLPQRTSVAYSSCGICGTDIIRDMSASLTRKDVTLAIEVEKIVHFHEILESRQDIFHVTGNTHAAGIFDSSGDLLAFSEDTGRHNALDKAIGLLVAERKLNEARVVVLTSRLSYEIVQKVTRFNVEILIGISTATSLAISLAQAVNLTLIGFSRKETGTIYTCPERILLSRS